MGVASLSFVLALPAYLALVYAAVFPAAVQAQVVKGLPDFTELVELVGPSVVNIRTLEKAKANAQGGAGSDDEMQELFRKFFGIPMPNAPRQNPRPNRPQPSEEPAQPKGVGSGFVLSSDGYIMTNAHVVEGADEVLVTLTDKREFKARIVGADKRTDVAVVKIQATGLPAIKVGDVSRLKVGEWVMAIGSPFGLENSVTAGIVSAKQRDTGDYLPFIQTDVAINPGNSGGPLINMRGEVVGITSQIYSRSGGFMGISFAIPMDEAIRVSDQLRQNGHVTRGRIGVQIGDVTKEVAESIGLGSAQGAFVRGIESGSPADKAGLEPGDIITRFDGKPIEKATDLPRLVGNTKPGTRSNLVVFRRGVSKELVVTIAELEPVKTSKAVQPAAEPKSVGTAQSMGLVVADLTDVQKKELKLKGGVRIESVAEASARSGLREGDVILSIANIEITQLRDFELAMNKIDKTKPFSVLFRRSDVAQYALIRPSR
ncbi:DegQ family serine endoprotease [Limnohabitans sp. Rim8]|uniref:DegQ family serine endoprotease n=1 Tax=Limnohabitans sp. Rim8 TaxID=1100718 RepID=UPI0026194645|nr:DegQ family serine endoprotease [Limnohabitans sp. Rim8]